MRSNPGGQLAPNEILGRDSLILKLWRTLEGRSIYMNDLRRIGKTQIMVKMAAESHQHWKVIKSDLGGFHSAAEFATETFRSTYDALGGGQKIFRNMSALFKGAKGVEIPHVIKLPNGGNAPWKEVLRKTFADVQQAMEGLGSEWRALFLWDEVPFLLDNIAKREGASTAMEVFDALRALTQDHPRVRLLLTGSIGLHHILSELKRQGYSNSPLNNMEKVSPGPLEDEHATELALRLLKGDGVQCAELEKCAKHIAASVGGVGFYIHKLVSRLPAKPVTTGVIQEILVKEITVPENDWDFPHYRERLSRYYGDQEDLALAVLDVLATAGRSLVFDDLRSRVSARMTVQDEPLRGLLDLLCRDHYLTKTTGRNAYRFYLKLIQRWWTISRGL